MLNADVIQPAMSDYNSPIVLDKRIDDTNRFCVNFRRINIVAMFDTEWIGNVRTGYYACIFVTLYTTRSYTNLCMILISYTWMNFRGNEW